LLLNKANLIAKRKFQLKAKLYSINATVIDQGLSIYEWADFCRQRMLHNCIAVIIAAI